MSPHPHPGHRRAPTASPPAATTVVSNQHADTLIRVNTDLPTRRQHQAAHTPLRLAYVRKTCASPTPPRSPCTARCPQHSRDQRLVNETHRPRSTHPARFQPRLPAMTHHTLVRFRRDRGAQRRGLVAAPRHHPTTAHPPHLTYTFHLHHHIRYSTHTPMLTSDIPRHIKHTITHHTLHRHILLRHHHRSPQHMPHHHSQHPDKRATPTLHLRTTSPPTTHPHRNLPPQPPTPNYLYHLA